MRLNEFASAAEQLALWRLVSDSVWQSIGLQAKQEQQQKAKRARMAKAKRPVRAKLAAPKSNPAQPIQQTKPVTLAAQKTQQSTTSTQPTNTSIGSLSAQTAGNNSVAAVV